MNNTENGTNAKSFIKKGIDFIPAVCFPKVNAQSLKVVGIIGFALGIATMLFSFIPCLGAYALYLAIPTLYVNLWAIRREEINATIFEILGLIFTIVGLIVGIYWCCALASAANAMEKSFKKFK